MFSFRDSVRFIVCAHRQSNVSNFLLLLFLNLNDTSLVQDTARTAREKNHGTEIVLKKIL